MPSPRLTHYSAYAERRDREQPTLGTPRPLVSVVTVVMNADSTIERAIRSVHNQSFPSIEHILVDGGSNDGTLDIVRRLARPYDYWISESDQGISDAFNKGVALARGSLIQILNADDWLSPDQVERAVEFLGAIGTPFVFGDVIFYEEDKPVYTYVGDPTYSSVITRRMPSIAHATVLAARECFERAGLFDLRYRNAMDYDWLLRLHNEGISGAYSPAIVGNMTRAGVSNTQYKRTIDEVRQISIAHGRNSTLASFEARARYLKTAAAQPVRRYARPAYELIRRALNPSYRSAHFRS